MFTLEVTEGEVIIWYGPKQERLSRCHASPDKVAQRVAELRNRLGSPCSPEEFLSKLYDAYRAIAKDGEAVPITRVLAEVSKRYNGYGGYSRADFSYDLYRVRDVASEWGLHLVVATRAYTRRRSDFLWVPDDQTGKGTVYSHLKFNIGGETMDKQTEVKVTVDQAEAQADEVEKAWQVLITSGVITTEDKALMLQRHKDRKIFAIASDALAKAKSLTSVVAVNIVTAHCVYVVEDGQPPKIVPRVTTNAPRRTRASEAKTSAEASTDTGDDASNIPTEILKMASDALGLKWFGAKNARRSKRVLEKARELMIAGQ